MRLAQKSPVVGSKGVLEVQLDKEHLLLGETMRVRIRAATGPLGVPARISVKLAKAFVSVGGCSAAEGPSLEFDSETLELDCNGVAEFETRVCFPLGLDHRDLVVRLMASCVVNGQLFVGRSPTIKLCSYHIVVTNLARMADDVCGWCTYYNLRCELISAFGASGGASKPLVLTLLDDDGKALEQSQWRLVTLANDGKIFTDHEGAVSLGLGVKIDAAMKSFRIQISTDWFERRELLATRPAITRRLSNMEPIWNHNATTTTMMHPMQHDMRQPQQPPSIPELVYWLKQFEWVDLEKDALLICPCCRAIKSRSSVDLIKHRRHCQFGLMLSTLATAGGPTSHHLEQQATAPPPPEATATTTETMMAMMMDDDTSQQLGMYI